MSANLGSQYRTLDGIRGIAALIVMTRHLPDMYGFQTFPRCYLAVDLFFVLSGFVIANAYAGRLAEGMGLREFMRLRFIRFFPFYILAFGLGLVSLALELAMPDSREWTPLALASAIVFGTFLLPAPMSPAGALYPINLPCWSLGFELAINAFYAAIQRWLSPRVLMVLVGLSAVGVLRYFLRYGNMNYGDGWDGLLAGAMRVSYSFFAGVLIWRWRAGRRASTAGALAVGAVSAAILMAGVPAMPFDIIMVLAGFPLLVWVAAQVEPQGRIAPVFINLGLASYGLYVVHTPAGQIIERIARLQGFELAVPAVGIVFMVLLTWAVLWLDRHFDQPLRRWLVSSGRRPAIA